MKLLQETPWPGNVRELKQVVDAAAAFARGVLDRTAIETAMLHRFTSDRPRCRATEHLAARTELVRLLEHSEWDTERAATALGIHRATVYRRMKRHGIDVRSEAFSRMNGGNDS
jgi:transcriptional regulator of acetoin/glycerol metabolism